MTRGKSTVEMPVVRFVWLLSAILQANYFVACDVTGEQYASVPEVFHLDNYDNCMLRANEAFYCSLKYEIEPVDPENPSEVWHIIKNLSDVKTNYRHDWLRHWICVPKTCPGVNKTDENDPELRKNLEKCYNEKHEVLGLKGTITELQCETAEPKYPFDWLDCLATIFFSSIIAFVLWATMYEGYMRYKPPEEYSKFVSTTGGKVLSAFSLTNNWIRLKTVNSTKEVEQLRCIQGYRVYNTALVLLCHTLLGFVAAPVINTRYTETMHEKNGALFFASGPLCVTTFFFISSFLLSNGIFDYLKRKKMSLKVIMFAIANRIFRITPTVFVVVLFHATLLRHLGRGPNWDVFINSEYLRCRNNGWTNLLYLNNWIHQDNMCVPVMWTLGLDTQYFIMTLFFIWLLKSYEDYFEFLIGIALSINMLGTFAENYYFDFTGLVSPTAELYYGMKDLFSNEQFKHQLCSVLGNTAGPIVGIAFGYYYHNHKNDEVAYFNSSKFRIFLWWCFSFVLGFSFVISTGSIILNENVQHDRFWAAVYVAVSRPVMATVIGVGLIGMTQGVGWLALRVCRWGPTYVLGRLSLSTYLVHMSIILSRPALARYPLYLSDFQIFLGFLGDWGLIYLVGAMLTLCLELPVSQIQKLVFNQREEGQENEELDVKKDK